MLQAKHCFCCSNRKLLLHFSAQNYTEHSPYLLLSFLPLGSSTLKIQLKYLIFINEFRYSIRRRLVERTVSAATHRRRMKVASVWYLCFEDLYTLQPTAFSKEVLSGITLYKFTSNPLRSNFTGTKLLIPGRLL